MNALTLLRVIFIMAIAAVTTCAYAWDGRLYGERFCDEPGFRCHVVRGGETWERLFPDPQQRDIVMRLNRMNIEPVRGIRIAVPDNLSQMTMFDISPFPLKVSPTGEKQVIANISKLAWGAYDQEGYLIFWGPLSSAKGWCEDQGEECTTPRGSFQFQGKDGYNCISKKFPLPDGGAAMPFCMYFHDGYAMHGSFDVPGFNASHGCIRMFINDARWLNQTFVSAGTKVIVS